MTKFGVSLHIGTLLDVPETEPQAVLLREFGGAEKLLSYLKCEGVNYIEVRNVREHITSESSIDAIRVVQKHGFSASLHIAFENRTGEEYVERRASVIKEALGGQDSEIIFTVHPLSTEEKTAEMYCDWTKALSQFDKRCRLALENMRVRKPDREHFRLANVANTIKAMPKAERGACYDTGHYAYNVVTSGLPITTSPSDDVLSEIIHTHIHSLYMPDLDTHFPLARENEAVLEYIRALRKNNYSGIYNIELEPERFIRVMSPCEGFKQSVRALKEVIL